MSEGHSRFGGSSIGRVMACPGSAALALKAPPERASRYAEEGTLAHGLAELCLTSSLRVADSYVGKEVAHPTIASTEPVTQEMADAVNVYLLAVWDEFDLDETSEIGVEQRFALAAPAADDGEIFGSNDALIYSSARKKLTIFDYKHGAGVIVDVEESDQLRFYAIGALQGHPEWTVDEIELVVVQPRAFNAGEDNGVKRWTMPMYQLVDFPAEVDAAVAAAKSDKPPFKSGDHCRWCPAAAICTVVEQQFLEAARVDFASIVQLDELPAVDDVEHLAAILTAFEPLAAWIGQIRERVDQLLMAGTPVPGWKVVEKVARRKWVGDEMDIAAHLALMHDINEELVRPRKLVTITEAKRLLKGAVDRHEYAEAERDLTLRFTIKEPSGLTTAPESDRREAIAPVAAEFGSVYLGSEG